MIKKIAWDMFKNTGNINTFLEYKQIENAEKGIQEIQKITNMNVKNIENIKTIVQIKSSPELRSPFRRAVCISFHPRDNILINTKNGFSRY